MNYNKRKNKIHLYLYIFLIFKRLKIKYTIYNVTCLKQKENKKI